MNPAHSAHPVDVHVGNRIRARREALGLTCADLAAGLGLSAGDVEAIENGRRRAGAEDLYGLTRLLDVRIAFFFDHAAAPGAASALRVSQGAAG